METKFKQVSAFDWKLSPEHFEGKYEDSQTVPCQAISIKEIVRKSLIGAPLPPIDFSSDLDGEEEGFDDAFEYPEDKLAVMDKGQYLRNYVKRVEEAKKAAKAEKSPNNDTSLPSPTEDMPKA